MYKHLRGKSDTDFVIDKLYLDNIHYNIKNFCETKISVEQITTKKPQSFQTQSHILCNIYIPNKHYNSDSNIKAFKFQAQENGAP